PTFRHAMYDQYKAQRPPMPDDLRQQIEPIHAIIKAMGLPLLVVPGVEADDVIGTLAQQATEQGVDTLISTGDKDMAQLVSDHVKLVNTMTNTYMDRDGVVAKFGITAEQIVDYLAITGDKVDNIPGVPGAGPKTAVKWLNTYGNLQNLMANADEIGGKIGEKLRAALPDLPLSQQLTTIKLDVALDHGLQDIKPQPVDQAGLLGWYEELEFASWARVLQAEGVSGAAPELSATQEANTQTTGVEADKKESAQILPPQVDNTDYQLLLDEQQIIDYLQRCQGAEYFAFDTETTSLDYMQAQLVGVSLSLEPGVAVYIPCAHDYVGAPDQIDRGRLIALLKPLLEDPQQLICGQNLKYDINVLANYGIQWQAQIKDSMLQSYVYNSTATRHNLDDLASVYLDHQTLKFTDIAGKGAKQLTFNQIDLEQAMPYAAEDADIALRLCLYFDQLLAQEESLRKVYKDIEQPLIPVLADIERTGAKVDAMALGLQSQSLGERLQELERHAHDLAGEIFNLASTKQLGGILYDKLGLPVLKKTPKGQPSTAEPVLQELAQDYELPRLLLEHRSLAKLKSTYTDKLPQQINKATGRIHTSYHQGVTATGRLSSSDPNLQNIPIRSSEGRRIRQAFVAPAGQIMLAADYSQIELRIMAHLSGDEGLLNAFAQGQDVHRATAAEVFEVAPDQVTGDQRRSAKAINFGLIYGMSAFGLAKQLGISRGESQDYIGRYFSRYPGVQEYMDNTRTQAADQGYVETIFGRRLYLPDINARNAIARQAAERTAINAPMQGSAADIIKLAMIRVSQWLQSAQLDARIIMQVHDELVFEVAQEQLSALQTGVKQAMEGAAQLQVPLLVDMGTGSDWDQAH
ncbi:MAG: DNA polymerase I, partial [Pseudomonadales bacterium]